jgi:hypothetical protein
MIQIDGTELKKDGALVTFPIDNSGRPTAMLVGFDENEVLRPVRINSEGKLLVDSNVTVDGISIGSVGITAEDSTGTVGVVNRVQNAGLPITSSLMTVDPRMTFNLTELKTLAYGQNAGVDYPLSTDATGKLNVNISSAATTQTQASDALVAVTPAATTDALTDVVNINCRRMIHKTLVIKNTGAASASITITGSVDLGATFPIPLTTNYEVAAGLTYVYTHDSAVTNIKVAMQSYVAGTPTTVGITAYVMGA